MTDLTDQDRRDMLEWARLYIGTVHDSTPLGKVARHVLTTVEAPPLSEELANITENWEEWATDTITAALSTFTTRAEQMEFDLEEARNGEAEMQEQFNQMYEQSQKIIDQRDEAHSDLADVTEVNHEIRRERDEARAEIVRCREVIRKHKEQTDRAAGERDEALAEVERLTDVNEELRKTDNYKEFKEQFLTVQKDAESNAESPDPADVKPGEAWLVEVDGERRNALKDRDPHFPWNTVGANNRFYDNDNKDITLIARLVPAPRVITDPDELDEAIPVEVVE